MSFDVSALVDRCRDLFEARPAGLLTDIDGTISFIAPTPDAASVSAEAVCALERLAARLDIVGAVTGRAAENAESMIGVPGLVYVGNHGLEERAAGMTEVIPAAAFATAAIAETMSEVRAASERLGVSEGIIYENKGVSASIHYRLAPEQDAARDVLLPLTIAAAEAHGLKVTEGRMVIEIRPSLAINKGSAVAGVVERNGLKSLVFLGDDVTDIDGFRALSRLRSEGRLVGVNVAVVAPESHPEVALSADVAVPGVECCVQLLSALADSFESNGAAN